MLLDRPLTVGRPLILLRSFPRASLASRGFGVALGAALLALVAVGDHVTVDNFRVVFLLIAAIPPVSMFGFMQLSEDDGAEVNGHASHAVTADDKAKQGAGS